MGKGDTCMTSRSYFQRAQVPTTDPFAHVRGKVGHKYGTVVTTLPSPGVKRSAIATGPPRTIHIRATLFVTAFSVMVHVFPKYDDLPRAHA
jgi:hypothetical protein